MYSSVWDGNNGGTDVRLKVFLRPLLLENLFHTRIWIQNYHTLRVPTNVIPNYLTSCRYFSGSRIQDLKQGLIGR